MGGKHRFDYGGGSHVCVMLSGGNCTAPDGSQDYSHCATRCWGYGEAQALPKSHLEAERSYVSGEDNVDEYRTLDGDSSLASDVWEYSRRASAQGEVKTVAGSPKQAGFRDTSSSEIGLFNSPSGVAIDAQRNIYVADTLNHAIRVVDAVSFQVTTLAGGGPPTAVAGDRDGQCRF